MANNWTDLRKNKISELYIKNNVYVYVNRQTFVWGLDYIWKKYIWNWRKIIGIFHFFINFFMKTLIKSIIYFQTVPIERLLIYLVNIVYQVSLLSFLTWVSLAIFCLNQWLTEIVYRAQHQLPLVEDNSWWVIAAVELYVNATYFVQHPALKSVYRKIQSVIVGKLFYT